MTDKYKIKYKTVDGVKESEYGDVGFFESAKRYILQQYGPDAIIETKTPLIEGAVQIINE